jgi:hypothetical protein
LSSSAAPPTWRRTAYLAATRWPEGFDCPESAHAKAQRLDSKAWTYECSKWHRQTSVTAGTVMPGSKLSLLVWFWAAWLMATHTNGISALQLRRHPALGPYKSAWLLAARLRRAMRDPGRSPLMGLVEADETEIVCRSKNCPQRGGGGRSWQGRMLVAGAVEVTEAGPGRLSRAIISDFSRASLHAFLKDSVLAGGTVKTDGWSGYSGAAGVALEPVSSATPPPMSCCHGPIVPSPTQGIGRWTSITVCAVSTCKPISTSSSSASTAGAPAMPPSAPC